MEQILSNLAFSSMMWQVITPLIFSGLDILTRLHTSSNK